MSCGPARMARSYAGGEGFGWLWLQPREEDIEDGQDGGEEKIDDVAAQEEEAEHEVEAHALVGPGGVEGKVVHENLAAVEEREWNEVEDEEQQVDQDAEVEEEDEREDARKTFGAHGDAHGEIRGNGDRVAGARDGVAHDDEREEGKDGGEQLGGGAG